MAPTKVEAKAIKARCDSVRKAVDHAEECPARVKKMLCSSLSLTVGIPKVDRHPFNERFVTMIEQVLEAEQAHLTGIVSSQEAAFAETSPAKATREAALEQAKLVAAQTDEALLAAKNAVTDGAAHLGVAKSALQDNLRLQHASDEKISGITAKRDKLDGVVRFSLAPILAGTDEELTHQKNDRVKLVLSVGKAFGFDSSLMSTAAQVLAKSIAERGAFDGTCLQQLQDAFTSEIAKFDEQLAAEAPGKAELAAAVEHDRAKEQAAQACLVEFKQKASDAKEAKDDADWSWALAAQSLAGFMPDLKAAGDALDHAKSTLQHFVDGPLTHFRDLKEFKEGDFKPVAKPKKIEAEAEVVNDHTAAQGDAEESPSKRARTE